MAANPGNIYPAPQIRQLSDRLDQPQLAAAAGTDVGLRQFSVNKYALQANVPQPVDIPGDYLYCHQSSVVLSSPDGVATNLTLTVRDSNGNVLTLDQVGRGFIFPAPFSGIILLANQAVTISLYVGYGRVQNDFGIRYALGIGDSSVQEFFRPANVTAYAAGQFVSDGAAALLFVRVARQPRLGGIITRARLSKSTAALANANFSLHLLPAGSSPIVADQAAFAMDYATYRFSPGIIQFPTFVTGGAGSTMSFCDIAGISLPFITDSTLSAPQAQNIGGGGTLGAVLVTNAPYVTGNAETFRLELFTDKY